MGSDSSGQRHFAAIMLATSTILLTKGALADEEEPKFESLRAQEGCASRSILCLFLEPPAGTKDDERPVVDPGESLTIKVIGKTGTPALLQVKEVRTTESLSEQAARAGSSINKSIQSVSYEVLVSKSLNISNDAVSLEVTLGTGTKGTRNASALEAFSLTVNRGRYFVRPAILFPAMFGGDNAIYTSNIPGSADRVIRGERQVAFVPALAINIYPAGRPNGVVSSFGGPFGRWRWLAVQAGAGLDFTKPCGFLGLGIELVSGFTLSGGAGVRFNATLLDRGYEDGSLMRPNQTLPAHTGPLGFGYMGVALSTEIIDTLRAVKASL